MTNKENVLSKLKALLKVLNETAPANLTLDNIAAELEEIIAEIQKNL